MRSLNPFTGGFYLETLQVARYTRDMYCLFGGRHTHPSTIMPGGCSAHITHQTLTDYYVRLMRYFDYVKRSVMIPMRFLRPTRGFASQTVSTRPLASRAPG